MSSVCGYRQLDHTADLALEIWAPSEEALLVEAAKAIVSLMTHAAEIAPTAEREVELSALDGPDRLVVWLNEVLVLATVKGFLTAGARLDLRGHGLVAKLVGEEDAADKIETELKSVTYHDLELVVGTERCTAHIVIDV